MSATWFQGPAADFIAASVPAQEVQKSMNSGGTPLTAEISANSP